MANEIPSPKEKDFLSKLWKAHSTVAPFVGLFGIPAMYAFLPKAAVLAKAADPGAGLLDMVFTLWGMMGKTLVEFAAPGGSIIPIVSVKGRVSLPSAGLVDVPITLEREGANHYQGRLTLPRSGNWELELIVQVRDGVQDVLHTTVPVP